MGYAFINFINKKDILPFVQHFNNKKWMDFKSGKVKFNFLNKIRFVKSNMQEYRENKNQRNILRIQIS